MWDQFSNSQICLRFRLSIVLEMFSSNYLPTVCCLVIHLILENCWFIEFLRLTRYYSHIHLNDKTHLECFMPQIGSWCICDQSNHKQILIIDIVKLCCVDDMSILYQFCLYSTQFVYFNRFIIRNEIHVIGLKTSEFLKIENEALYLIFF